MKIESEGAAQSIRCLARSRDVTVLLASSILARLLKIQKGRGREGGRITGILATKMLYVPQIGRSYSFEVSSPQNILKVDYRC